MSKLWQNIGFSVLRILVLAYIGLVVVLYFNQSRMVYFPTVGLQNNPKQVNLDYEPVNLTTQDGILLSAWFVPAQGDAPTGKGVILYCHGNAGNIGHRLDYIQNFHRLGLATFIFDYRGFGESKGEPTEAGTYADVEAAWEYLTVTKKIPANQIIVYGESLGGAIATYIAAKKQPGGLILAATFTSLNDRAAEIYPYIPIRLISKFSYDSLARISQIHRPILIMHSPDDEVIPFHHGKSLFAAANEPKEFVQTTGDHNNGFLNSEPAYSDSIDRYVKSVNIHN